MKIRALNSSPHAEERSKTELMLKHLIGGMREAGAERRARNDRSRGYTGMLRSELC